MTSTAKSGIHYAWIILAAACVLSLVSRADSASFAVFIDPLVERFGWKRGDISFAYALAFLAGLPAMLVMGWLGDRYGARLLMIGASFLISAGTVLLGSITELWHFYVIYGIFVGSLGNAAFLVLLPVIMTRWFERHMGLALGIYWAALGSGPVVFAPLFRWLIETQGWEQAFTQIGILFGVILLACSVLIRNSPREMGLTAYGAEGSSGSRPVSGTSAAAPVTFRDLLTGRPLWLLMGIHHLGCAGHAVILAHGVSMATHHGIPGIEAAGVLSTIAGVSIISRFAFSILTERFGGRAVLTLAVVGQSTSVLFLLFATEAWEFYLFAVVFGICYGGEMVGFPIINRQLFGAGAPLSSIYSFEMVGASTGMALGGWLGGMLFDASGDYTWAILVSAVIGYLALPMALYLPRHKSGAASVSKAVGTA
jgi:MFS family permease